ncbi:helix-turn-helix transcriptional regulator [Altererythrobacter lutimaris]|uniref:AlpA family phage regulatory protein n=1 Tax=Altererythrobacter lutimaris TaxID=2743979 RepID=A0A850H2L5_9SPHN|nr:AlpA family phage regulatory protein [Altererythrobacter lutimaris]
MQTQLLSPKGVCELTSLSRSTIDRLVAAKKFPEPIRITSRRLAYNAAEVEAWLQDRIAA